MVIEELRQKEVGVLIQRNIVIKTNDSEREENYIKNAKALLMERNHLTEEEAHRYIQKSSMDNGTNMVETAQMILTLLFEEG